MPSPARLGDATIPACPPPAVHGRHPRMPMSARAKADHGRGCRPVGRRRDPQAAPARAGFPVIHQLPAPASRERALTCHRQGGSAKPGPVSAWARIVSPVAGITHHGERLRQPPVQRREDLPARQVTRGAGEHQHLRGSGHAHPAILRPALGVITQGSRHLATGCQRAGPGRRSRAPRPGTGGCRPGTTAAGRRPGRPRFRLRGWQGRPARPGTGPAGAAAGTGGKGQAPSGKDLRLCRGGALRVSLKQMARPAWGRW
jgi:hypothetical protein